MFIFQPPKIIHKPTRPTRWKQMVIDAAMNLRLGKRQTALLTFYAGQSTGFRPALKLIENRTGIPPNKVSEYRQQLELRGVIEYKRDERRIIIKWDVIQGFAMMEEPVPYHLSKCSFWKKPEKRIWYKHKVGKHDTTETEQWFWRWSNGQTETWWRKWLTGWNDIEKENEENEE